jgi:uncharacterized membrane protein
MRRKGMRRKAMRMCKNDLKFFLYLIKKEMMMRNYVNRFARSSFVRFNSSSSAGSNGSGSNGSGSSSTGSGGGGRRPAGPHVLIPLLVGYYLIFKPLEN